MNAHLKSITKAIAVATLVTSACLGSLPTYGADQEYGYCRIPLCTSAEKAGFFKYYLGLGDSKVSYWDCRIQGTCLDISKSIGNLQMNEQDCSTTKLESLRKNIGEYEAKLLEVAKKVDPNVRAVYDSRMVEGLEKDLISHYVKCEKAGYFKPDVNSCVTAFCQRILKGIDSLQVNEAGCEKSLPALTPSPYTDYAFAYEKELIQKRIDAFKDKCIAGNLIPAKTVLGRAVLQKDVAFADQCQGIVDNIEAKTADSQVNKEGCTLDLYNQLNSQVATLNEDLKKLDTMAVPNKSSTLPSNLIKDLDRKIDEHFVSCSNDDLFPPDTSKCFSKECKKTQAKIEAFRINKDDCVEGPRMLKRDTHYRFENALVEKWLDAYEEKCREGDGLPYATLGMRRVYKSEYEAAQKELNDTIAQMGRHGEHTKFGGALANFKRLTYEGLIAKVNSLKLNEQNCNYNKSLNPLEMNFMDYREVYRESGFDAPKEFDDAFAKFQSFQRQCHQKDLFNTK